MKNNVTSIKSYCNDNNSFLDNFLILLLVSLLIHVTISINFSLDFQFELRSFNNNVTSIQYHDSNEECEQYIVRGGKHMSSR